MGLTLGAAAEAAPDSAESWQIACATRPWDLHEYPVALDAIAEAGYKYAGLMTSKSGLVITAATTPEDAHKAGEACKQRGLEVVMLYGGDIPIQESLDAGIAGMHRLIDNAVAAGSRTLMMGGVGDPVSYDPYYKSIAACCDYAAEKHLQITLKPHGGSNATGPQCRKAIEMVGHKNFRLWYDPGNIFYYSDYTLNPVDDAPMVAGLVSGMCVKDFSPPKEVLLTPGTGKVDFPAVMAKLQEGGFTGGPLMVECLKVGELPQLLEEAKKAKEFVENLVRS